MAYCDVCQGSKTINLTTWPEMDMGVSNTIPSDEISVRQKQFPCPQCQMVPYRRVRAMKVTTGYPAEEFGRLQVPIERGLAARFGEYLMREGLIKFTTSGSADLGAMKDKITITAHLGVVSPVDVVRAEAEPEIATTAAPKLDPTRYGKKMRGLRGRGRPWAPPPIEDMPDDIVTDEFDEPKDALGARFSGLEIE